MAVQMAPIQKFKQSYLRAKRILDVLFTLLIIALTVTVMIGRRGGA